MRVLATIGVLLCATIASAEETRELCTKRAVYRGPVLDLDVKNADIHNVFRLLADVGRVSIVVPDDVRATVTLRLKRVAWQQIACTVAAVHRLEIIVDGNVLIVRRRQSVRTPRNVTGVPSSTNAIDTEFRQ